MFQAGLRARELESPDKSSEDSVSPLRLPVFAHSGLMPQTLSLTVAGAAPALLFRMKESRTGFPFNPLEAASEIVSETVFGDT
jgi:hypothetical protein